MNLIDYFRNKEHYNKLIEKCFSNIKFCIENGRFESSMQIEYIDIELKFIITLLEVLGYKYLRTSMDGYIGNNKYSSINISWLEPKKEININTSIFNTEIITAKEAYNKTSENIDFNNKLSIVKMNIFATLIDSISSYLNNDIGNKNIEIIDGYLCIKYTDTCNTNITFNETFLSKLLTSMIVFNNINNDLIIEVIDHNTILIKIDLKDIK